VTIIYKSIAAVFTSSISLTHMLTLTAGECPPSWVMFATLTYETSSDEKGARGSVCLRHCAAIREVGSSIPDEVIGFFNSPNPSSRTMALGSTQPLTEMSIRNFPCGKRRSALKADNRHL
jgi:hypothetical protein